MSFPKKDRNLRASEGTGFPVDPVDEIKATLSLVVADALRRDFGDSPVQQKQIARLMGLNHRTIRNWLQSRNGPSGAGLVMLMRHSAEVTAAVLTLSGRTDERRLVRMEALQHGLKNRLLELLQFLDPA